MAAVRNASVIFNSIPEGAVTYFAIHPHFRSLMTGMPLAGLPEPGKTLVYDTSEKIDLENVSLNGGVLVKTLAVSIDPYQRGRMRPVNVESYLVCPSFVRGKTEHLLTERSASVCPWPAVRPTLECYGSTHLMS